jgi:methionyl-tRNA formyltransferase
MRLAFLGTPEAAVAPLRALVEDGHDIAVVVTQPDRKRGRGGALVPSPVKEAAADLGLVVAHDVDAVLGRDIELGVVVAFGKLIKPHVLAEVPMVNIHFSLLPRWRGAAPLERAILAGDTETGVCLMALEEGLDTGPVYECERLAIGPDETADHLRARLVDAGTAILRRRLRDGLGEPVVQEGEATYAKKIEPDELHLDWTRPAEVLNRVVRLGRAWTTLDGRRLLVLRAVPVDVGPAPPGTLDGLVVGAGDGRGLRLEQVQPEGKARQPAAAWRNGLHASGALVLGR